MMLTFQRFFRHSIKNNRNIAKRRSPSALLRLLGSREHATNVAYLVTGAALLMDITCSHCKKSSPAELISGRAVVAFRATCPHCVSDLHTCHNCSLHDPGAYHECRETSAEWVKDKERGNKCEYFSPRSTTSGDTADAKGKVKSALDDLFK